MSELFCAVLCAEVLHNDTHTHTSSYYSWLLIYVYTLLKTGWIPVVSICRAVSASLGLETVVSESIDVLFPSLVGHQEEHSICRNIEW